MPEVSNLYTYLKNNGGIGPQTTEQAFAEKMQDKGSRESLFQYMKRNGMIGDQTDFESFDNRLGARNRTVTEKIGDFTGSAVQTLEKTAQDAGKITGNLMSDAGNALSSAADFIMHPKGIQRRDLGDDVRSVEQAVSKAGTAVRKALTPKQSWKLRRIGADMQAAKEFVAPEGGYDNPLVAAGKGVLNAGASIDQLEKEGATALADIFQNAADMHPVGSYDKQAMQSVADKFRNYQVPMAATPVKANVKPGSLADLSYQTTDQLAGRVAPAVIVGLITKNPATATTIMAGEGGLDAYQKAKNLGATPDKAAPYAITSALIQKGIYSIPVGYLLKPEYGFFQRVAGSAVAGGISSYLGTGLQMALDKGTVRPDMTFGEAVDAMNQSGASGALLGGLMGAVSHPFVYRKDTIIPNESPESGASQKLLTGEAAPSPKQLPEGSPVLPESGSMPSAPQGPTPEQTIIPQAPQPPQGGIPYQPQAAPTVKGMGQLVNEKLQARRAAATVSNFPQVQQYYSYMTQEIGIAPIKAAGILGGGILPESSGNPAAINKSSGASGLFQHLGSRKKAMVNAVPDWATNPFGQINFAITEPQMKKYLAGEYHTVDEAVQAFTKIFEIPHTDKKALDQEAQRRASAFTGNAPAVAQLPPAQDEAQADNAQEEPEAPVTPVSSVESQDEPVSHPTPVPAKETAMQELERTPMKTLSNNSQNAPESTKSGVATAPAISGLKPWVETDKTDLSDFRVRDHMVNAQVNKAAKFSMVKDVQLAGIDKKVNGKAIGDYLYFKDGKGYNVTHIPTGRMIERDLHPDDARELVYRLSLMKNRITKDTEDMSAFMKEGKEVMTDFRDRKLLDGHPIPVLDKEPWQMTPSEYVDGKSGFDQISIARIGHAKQVRQALEEGKDVPTEVLEAYRFNGWAKKALDARQGGSRQVDAHPESQQQTEVTEPTISQEVLDVFAKDKVIREQVKAGAKFRKVKGIKLHTKPELMKPGAKERRVDGVAIGDYLVFKDGKNYNVTHIPTGKSLQNNLHVDDAREIAYRFSLMKNTLGADEGNLGAFLKEGQGVLNAFRDRVLLPGHPVPEIKSGAVDQKNGKGVSSKKGDKNQNDTANERNGASDRGLGEPGDRTLEGVPADKVQGAEEVGRVVRSGKGSGAVDRAGNGSADGSRVPGARSVGNGEGELPVPAGGGRAEGEVGQGTLRKPVRGAVQRDHAPEESGDQPELRRGDEERIAAETAAAESSTPVVPPTAQVPVKSSDRPAKMFTITEDVGIGEGGAKTKFRNNIAAIKLLKALEAEKRMATHDEQKVLALYVGWGGIPQAFVKSSGMATKAWEKEAEELQFLLTKDEYEAARRSTQDAHYTSREVVNVMWQAVRQMGFSGGAVLEPSLGVGNFIGLMPTDLRSASQITAIELDNITGAIAKHLYPAASISAPVGFQDVPLAEGFFSLAIGNPPFGAQKLYDSSKQGKELNGFSIHNYFFAKSINSLRDGGVLAMVVSNSFLDSSKDKARQYIASRTDFLGAIRLPNNAFAKNAGTEVTTDIIFLRKKGANEKWKMVNGETALYKTNEHGEAIGQPILYERPEWTDIRFEKDKNGIEVPLNEYFWNHPDMMLGEWGAFGSMYGPDQPALVAKPGQDTKSLLKEAIAKLPKGFMVGVSVNASVLIAKQVEGESNIKVGSMFESDGQIFRKELAVDTSGVQSATAVPVSFNSLKDAERVKGMIQIRDIFTDLRKAQIDENESDKQIEFLRKKLNTAYDKFTKKFGYINGQTNKRLFREDPTWPQISALEEGYNKGVSAAVAAKTGEQSKPASAKKAAIFTKRTQQPYRPVTKVGSAKDGLSASLSEFGRINIRHIEALYGKSEDEIVAELGPLVFYDPDAGLVTRDDYLSGNVKRKLARAKEAAREDSKYSRNVDELTAVIPADIPAVDIYVKAGAPWVPAKDVKAFVTEVTGDPNAVVTYTPYIAKWEIKGRASDAMQSMYGTDRRRAEDIVEAALNGTQLTVYDRLPDGKQVTNQSATAAANDKVELVKERWSSWIWQDDERRERLSRLYNDIYNADVVRRYDGSHLTFPGKISDDIIRLRPHQANAVWRILQRGRTLLDHVVGAGKTFTMIAAAMEMRRMGLAKKPVFVVPNHLVGQWASDFVKLYPGANVLAPAKQDFEATNRKRLFSRIATGDWDAVIVAHSSFKFLQSDPKFERQFLEMQIAEADEAIDAHRQEAGKDSRSIKQMEKDREKLRARLARLLDSGAKDDNLTVAELGVDALYLDEAHEFKNLAFHTSMNRVGSLNPAGSQKASDMFTKVLYVLDRTGGKNVVFATGTPISNTMAEMFTMQRYLQYAEMKEQGVSHFDAWAKMYGEVVSDWELSPAGKYVMRSRFSKFINVPELMQQYSSFADVISRDDINRQLAERGEKLPVPKMVSGKPVNVVVERSEDQAQYIGVPKIDSKGHEVYPEGCLIYRSEHLPKRPEKGADNMLVIMSLARKAALDMRLINPAYPDYPGSKVNACASSIIEQYKKWDRVKGTQLVFCDLSIPANAKQKEVARITELIRKADEGDEEASEELGKLSPDEIDALQAKFSVYDALKEKLIRAGIPEHEIAFIHDATTDIKKEELFGKVRSGRVRVLMGSTPKMGAGMNVQERLVALHHLDAPWRPSDLEQREGRIIRQGNKLYEADPEGFEVLVARYATKNTLDTRMWQTLETKARFIEQIKNGSVIDRYVEDIAGEAANSAEMKAASSGNPLILEEMTLRQNIQKLNQQKNNFDREQFDIRDKIRRKESVLEVAKKEIAAVFPDVKTAKEIGDFSITIDGKAFEKRADAGKALVRKIQKTERLSIPDIGTIGSFTIGYERVAATDRDGNTIRVDTLYIKGNEKYQAVDGFDVSMPTDAKEHDAVFGGIATRVFNAAKGGPVKEFDDYQQTIAELESDIPKLKGQVRAWGKDEELAAAKKRQREIIKELKPKEQGKGQATTSSDPAQESGDVHARRTAPNRAAGYRPLWRERGMPDRPESDEIKIGGRAIKLKPEDEPTRVESIRKQVEVIIGRALYRGKIKGRTRAGFYRQSNGELRVRNLSDVEVLAHEMAHYLGLYRKKSGNEFNKLYTSNRFRREVQNLSYTDNPKESLDEGFAEYVRLWLTQHDEAKSAAPEFTAAFENLLAKDKELSHRMRWLQDDMHRWYYQGDAARLRAKSSGNQYSMKERLQSWWADRPASLLRQQIIDSHHAAKVMERELTGRIADAEKSPVKQLDLLNGVEGIIRESFIHGAPAFNKKGEIVFNGPSMMQVWSESLKKGRKIVSHQEDYFVARRAEELTLQGRENLISKGEIKAGLAYEKKFTWFAKAFEDYQKYRVNMVHFLVDCGYVEPDIALRWIKVNQNYVPFNREAEGIGRAMASGAGNTKRLKGGTANIKHIYDNMILGDARMIAEALKTRALRDLYVSALKSEDGAKFIARLAPDSDRVRVTIDQQAKAVAEAMANLGLTLSKDGLIISGDPDAETITDIGDIEQVLLKNPELMQFWTFGHKPRTVGSRVESFIDPGTGKRVWFEISGDNELLVNMLDSLAGAKMPEGPLKWLLRAAYTLKNIQTLTITQAWNFAGGNIVRDTQEAFARSGGEFRPVIDNLIGMKHILHDLIKQEGRYHEMKAQGGGWAGAIRSQMTDVLETEKGDIMTPAPTGASRLNPVRLFNEALEVLMWTSEFFEMSTRVGYYAHLRKRGLGAREAAWQSRQLTTDFRTHGSDPIWTLYQRTIPFFSAYIQATDRDLRAFLEVNGEMKFRNLNRTEWGTKIIGRNGGDNGSVPPGGPGSGGASEPGENGGRNDRRTKAGRSRLKSRKVRMYLATGALVALNIMNALKNEDDDRYKELTPDQKARFLHFFTADQHFTIPKTHGIVSMLMAAGQAVVDHIKGEDITDTWKFLAFAVAYELSADLIPGALHPVYDLAVNKSFTGAPIIARHLENVEPRYQFTDRTPQLYVQLGKKLGVSPDAAHYLVKGYTGYLSDFIDEVSERILWDKEKWGERPFANGPLEFMDKPFVQRQVPFRTKWTDDYYDLKKRAAEVKATVGYLMHEPEIQSKGIAKDYLTKANQTLYGIDQLFAQIDQAFKDQDDFIASVKYNPSLSAKEKERKINHYYEMKNESLGRTYQQIKSAIDRSEADIKK